MTDITFWEMATATTRRPAKATKIAAAPTGKPKKDSLLRRLYDSMIEARRLEAEAMVKHHLYGGF
ncbi:MAG TPA: hypothetical protein VFQ90_03300 [Stellaceae bacterium]|nr:hypothetical protein [Stellaceae bacterium]